MLPSPRTHHWCLFLELQSVNNPTLDALLRSCLDDVIVRSQIRIRLRVLALKFKIKFCCCCRCEVSSFQIIAWSTNFANQIENLEMDKKIIHQNLKELQFFCQTEQKKICKVRFKSSWDQVSVQKSSFVSDSFLCSHTRTTTHTHFLTRTSTHTHFLTRTCTHTHFLTSTLTQSPTHTYTHTLSHSFMHSKQL